MRPTSRRDIFRRVRAITGGCDQVFRRASAERAGRAAQPVERRRRRPEGRGFESVRAVDLIPRNVSEEDSDMLF